MENVFSIFLSLCMAISKLAFCFGTLLRAKNIILCPEGGHGHTLIGPDAVRRHYQGERSLIVFGYGSALRHNKYVKNLWCDIDFLYLPIAFQRLGTKGNLFVCDRWRFFLFDKVQIALLFLWPKKNILSYSDFFESLPDLNIELHEPNSGNPGLHYYALLEKSSFAPPVRLSKKCRGRIEEAVSRCSIETWREPPKRCCLYLREKGNETTPDSQARSGSSVGQYLDAVRYLVGSGYQVFLTGDRQLSEQMRLEFGASFIDSKSIGIDDRLFALYAATEADIMIGNAGGGIWPATINAIPTLMVESFPYFFALPNATHYFKAVRDANGVTPKPPVLFNDLSDHYAPEGYSLAPNTALEIEAAVRDFVIHLDDGRPYGIPIHDVAGENHRTWFERANGRISPVWHKMYAEDVESPVELQKRLARISLAPSDVETTVNAASS